MSELPIAKEYEGSVCEIKTMENSLIAIGKIKDVTEKYVRIINKKKELKVVDYGKLIKVNIFNTQIGFRVIVGNVYTSTRGEISIVSVVSLTNKERRNFFRVDMDLDAKAYSSFSSKAVDIKVLDMSLSGLRFSAPKEFGIGSMISVELDLNKKKNLTFPCKIVRVIGENKEDEFQYGCEFVSGKNDNSDALCSFLFQKQREFLNSRKNV
ncbi:flagellar brake protein [Porcipelethomonas sp.]|uniref:flagellar brake protein n=1 Tax=Porcipelethomonas sp. TaxID=2981675 RepID=UPI003EF26BB4